jgi:hypothetical protein
MIKIEMVAYAYMESPTQTVIMGLAYSKLKVLTLNGQGGKTRRIKEMIQEEEKVSPGLHLNFIIQANNRSLVEQTSVRMDEELFTEPAEPVESDAKIEGGVFSWHSGTGVRITVDDLVGKILSGDVSMVVCCANLIRLNYLSAVITKLSVSFKRFKSPIKANIWIDEADASMCYWRDADFQDLGRNPFVEKVTMVTATVDAIVKEFKAIRVIPLEEPTLPFYFRVQDYAVERIPYQKMPAHDFIKMVAEGNPERYFTPGTRTFAPGAVERKSHEAICEWALSFGAAVVILNGLRKEIRIPNGEGSAPTIITLPKMKDSEKPEEIGRVIGHLYKKHKLERYALFITGNICLGRGITFQNDLFLFDHQILPPAFENRAAAYQAACRGAGNIKKLPNFLEREATGFQPTIVTTPDMWKFIVEAETIASTLAKKAHETGNCVFNEQDLAIHSGGSGGLEFSHVPVRFPLPAELQDIDERTHNIATWHSTVLDCLSKLDPALHADIVANYPEGHVDNYSCKTPAKMARHTSFFRPVYEAARKGLRARVPKFPVIKGKNIWYAALDHSVGKHLVICRWEGENYV